MYRPRQKPAFSVSLLFLMGFCTSSTANEKANDPFEVDPCPQVAVLTEKDFSSEFGWLDDFHNSFSGALDDSALWLNDQFSDEEHSERPGSKAWARLIMGWEPKTGKLDKFPLKFKIKVNLPNLKHKMNLVFSDNESEDFNRLPLETSRPASDSLHGRDFGAAIQLLHKSNEHAYFRSRIGIGSGQIYARTSYRWKKKFTDDLVLNIEPSLEYYIKDGIGYRFLTELSYFPDASSEFRGFYSIWDREDFDTPRWKKAVYHLKKWDAKTTFISGILINGVTSPNYRDEKITISTRIRRHALRKWLFFELEPFVDFERQDDYARRWGIALRVGGYFGYN